jgi:pimeloyl-ACP methyl ester carboxylesterase
MIEKKVKIRDDKVEINYYQQGQGNATLVFLHGWCINSTYWNTQFSHFAKHYSVYAIDLPGFGKSSADRENWTIEEYAKDVTGFIEMLGLENVILIGHSMSGEIMLQIVMNKNPRIIGLVGIDNFKNIDVEFTAEQMEQMSTFFNMLKEDFKNSAPVYAEKMLFHPSTSAEVKERVKNDIATSNPLIGFSTIMNYIKFTQAVPAKLEQLHYKLHLVHSDATPTNEKGLEARCKNGYEVKAIHATGHYPMIEKPDEFNQLLEELLENLD